MSGWVNEWVGACVYICNVCVCGLMKRGWMGLLAVAGRLDCSVTAHELVETSQLHITNIAKTRCKPSQPELCRRPQSARNDPHSLRRLQSEISLDGRHCCLKLLASQRGEQLQLLQLALGWQVSRRASHVQLCH